MAIGLLFSAQRVGLLVAKDRDPQIVSETLQQLIPWLAWALLLPLVYRAAERWPLGAGAARRNWWRYGAAAVVVPALYVGVVFVPITFARGEFALGYSVAAAYTFTFVNTAVGALIQFALVLAGCHAAIALRAAHEREVAAVRLAAQLADAELRVLRAQLQPHFLFNTLNAITAHVRDEPDVAEDMLSRLSALLRMVLTSEGEHEVPLSRELDLAGHYLGIHEVRFGGRLVVHYDVDPSVEQAYVPNMVLQPLIENAIAHGVARRRGPARINISAESNDATLLLRVADEGGALGTPHGDAMGTGLGLANTRARLSQLYGAAYRLELTQRPEGAVVELTLPLRMPA